MSKSVSVTAPRLWIVLHRAHHALSTLAEQSIANTGLGLSDFAMLESLLHKGTLTISEIQAKVLLASGSMTAAADRLEKKGLVVRKTTTRDRRARLLTLTPQGRRTVAAAFKKHARDLEAVMSVLDDSRKEQVYESLKTLGLFAVETQNAGPHKSRTWRAGKRIASS